MTETEPSGRSTPSEVLAREIADRLVSAGLVARAKREAVERGLATGTLTAEDWGLLVETAVDENERG